MTDERLRRALAAAGRRVQDMKRQLAWLRANGATTALDQLADQCQALIVRMELARRRWRR